ncbi:MAG: glycosyltransferase [Chitinophagaceae bacterium]|nr:glycosyltransferase [Chitinophagaceae bacterium]
MELKKSILIFYDHFYPSYKAGGPTQSLVNLVRELYEEYEIRVVCKPHEMGGVEQLKGIDTNRFVDWEAKAEVYYWKYGWEKRSELKKIIDEAHPDIIYVNGLYSVYFNLLPLWYAARLKRKKPSLQVVLSARGMLHPGALSQKSLKKKIYLGLFRWLHLHQSVTWHATDSQEEQFICNKMGSGLNIKQAANFPNLLPLISGPEKKENELIMGTVALISPMKNHLEALRACLHVKASVQWHIYGPVKDPEYWKKCKEVIKILPGHIRIHYHGELPPHLLTEAMARFQVFIMPSKSENFGHAIAEALSAGKPVITTKTTPFPDLEKYHCGFSVDTDQLQNGLIKSIEQFAKMNEQEFMLSAKAAKTFIEQRTDKAALKEMYHLLFTE